MSGLGQGPVEPPQDIREAANAMWMFYNAMINEGFTEAQAMTLIGKMFAARSKGGDGS